MNWHKGTHKVPMMPYNTLIHTRRTLMKINGYEIKPFADLVNANLMNANLDGANLRVANLDDADVTGTILEKKKDDKDLKIKELEEELKKYKDTLKALLDT